MTSRRLIQGVCVPTPSVWCRAGLGEVHSLSVDWAGDNVYFADVVLESILACSLRSHRCVVVLDNMSWLGAIAVDSNSG